ncbi:MAG: ADP-ribosylglycohydrolase family protein [Arcobacteraceae bacterium]
MSTPSPTKKEKIQGLFYASIVGDALCLGSHYEYDAQKIYKAYGDKNIEKFMSPGEMMGGQTHGIGWGERNYHPGKTAGGTTDYGDYNILVLEHLTSLAQKNEVFTLESLIPHWMDRFENSWGSWICTMTKETYSQIKQNIPLAQVGGYSNAMAIRHLAGYACFDDEDTIAHFAREVMFTHKNDEALDGAEFFARVSYKVLNGMEIQDAIETVAVKSSQFIQEKVKIAILKVEEEADESSALHNEKFSDDLALTSMARLWDVGRSEPIRVGKASPTEGTLPGALYIILKYSKQENALNKALVANAMIGGDNASRAIAIGMVLGAKYGINALNQNWLKSLEQYEYCEELLSHLPLMK